MAKDYKDFEKGGKRKKQPEVRTDVIGYWWQQTRPEDRAEAICRAGAALVNDSSSRSQANLRHARLYGNFSDSYNFGPREQRESDLGMLPRNRLTLNVVCSCVDTLAAKIAKTRPRPEFLTDAGNFYQQRSAKRLNKWVDGLFYETDIFTKAARVFFDGCIFDVGALKVYVCDGKIRFERVFPELLFVDDADALYGNPRQLFERRFIAREVLAAEFPEHAEAIDRAHVYEDAYNKNFGDVIEVWEGWHLPSSEKAGDGMHSIAIDGVELLCEPWKLDRFPFAFFRYTERVLGFWGQGVAERLAGIQLEINRLLISISEQLRRKGRGRIFVPKGSKIAKDLLTNGIADIIEFVGPTPPTVDNGNAVAAEEFQQLDRLYQRAYQEIGVSELSAGAKKPSGLDAAVALREYSDIESERFAMQGKRWEQLFLDATAIALDLLEDAPNEYRVKVPGKRSVEWIDKKDIKLTKDTYVLKMHPVSSLPQQPAARLQRIKEMEGSGYINKTQAQRLLDFPDIDAENNVNFAAADDVDQTISNILDLDKPKYEPPTPFTNLPLMIERATAAYNRVKHQEGVEPKRLGYLVQLIKACGDLAAPPPADATAAPAPAPGMPGDPMAAAAGAPAPMIGGQVTGGVNIALPNAPASPAVPPLLGV